MLKGVGETIGIVQYIPTSTMANMSICTVLRSLQYNVTLENLHAYCYSMLCFSTSLADVYNAYCLLTHRHT